MTKLTGVVRREVTGEDGRAYIITLTAEGLMLREKGRRTVYGPLAYPFLHYTAVARTVAAERTSTARRKHVSRNLLG
jgi:hypothetical protein